MPAIRRNAPFVIANLMPLLAFVTGVTTTAIVIAVVFYVVRVFAITAGYHRYFAHRSYKVARIPQFLLAFVGTMAAQKGPLWWAANHRAHHRYADTERDPHSPRDGFWWSHVGWVLSGRFTETDYDSIEDLARYPELRFLNRYDWIGPWALGLTAFLIGGWSGLIVGFFGSTVLLWHATFSVNSFSHVLGSRRYATADTSRNNVVVALATLGEGWHNNHHHYPACARQGFRWWELDVAYLVLRALAVTGLVRDLREPPESARTARQVRAGAFDVGRFRQYLGKASAVVPTDANELRTLLNDAERRAARLSTGDRIPSRA